ncbi:MAG: hypothetical protein LUI06_09840 [Ruminococcus sp.]|nr:hypothetical protein [Ruminococcus sp.]
MKISKVFAGMTATAMMAALAVMPASALDENEAVNATGTWTYTYTGSQLQSAVDDGSAQLSENEDGTYTLGCNIQVGHVMNAKLTMVAKSSTSNIFAGEGNAALSEDYFFTVQSSWTGVAPADSVEGTVKYTEETKKGATDLNAWDSGSVKFNGQWAQILLTDDDLSGVTVEVTLVADEDTTWEYHSYSEEDDADNVYRTFILFGSPSQIIETVSVDEINSQVDGGVTSGNYSSSATSSSDDSSSADTSSSSDDSSSTSSSSSSTSSSSDDSSSSSSGSSSSSSSTSSTSGSTSSSASGSTSTSSSASGSSTTTLGSSNTSGSSVASDNTENAESGAAAGVGLALAAIAGAAVVVTRKK